jgi:hypothetical protein
MRRLDLLEKSEVWIPAGPRDPLTKWIFVIVDRFWREGQLNIEFEQFIKVDLWDRN